MFYFRSELGLFLAQENRESLTQLTLIEEEKGKELKLPETPFQLKVQEQILEYLKGIRKKFDLVLEPRGTDFQKKVWDVLREIPYGETRSYQEIAERIGSKKAARAVGMANHRNPIMIVIPCHRVIGKNGNLVGYAGGLDKKETLLNLEKEYGGKEINARTI